MCEFLGTPCICPVHTSHVGTAITGPGGKQIILKQAPGGAASTGQPQIVQLVKTSQGMQVATVPKSAGGQSVQLAGQGQRIVQAAQGKTIPQGATIVKLVNAQGQPGKTLITCKLFDYF